jgi:hypothetical protein
MHQLLELVRSDFRTQKVAIVTAAMPFTEQQAAAFWPIYRQYEAELTTLWDQRLALIKDYAQTYQAMTDAKATQLADGVLRLEDEQVSCARSTSTASPRPWGRYRRPVPPGREPDRAAGRSADRRGSTAHLQPE